MRIEPTQLSGYGYVYHDCRHFHEGAFKRYKHKRAFCRHLRREIRNCEECAICPQCGAGTYKDSLVVDHNREGVLCLEIRVCPLCSRATMGVTVLITQEQAAEDSNQAAPLCSVKGCKHRAWEKFTYAADRLHYICSKHRDMVQVWKRKEMEPERFPLMENNSCLLENPKYRKAKR